MFEAGIFDLFFFPGGSPADLLSQYTQLTSKPYLPPFFSLGYHQSRWNYLDENDVLIRDDGRVVALDATTVLTHRVNFYVVEDNVYDGKCDK